MVQKILALRSPVSIRHGCFYESIFQTKEAIATDKNLREIADWIGVDQVLYLEPSDLEEVLVQKSYVWAYQGEMPLNRGSAELH